MSLKRSRLKKIGDGTQNQVKMFGMRNQRQEDKQQERVRPPHRMGRRAGFAQRKASQIGEHQQEDQRRDHTGFRRYFAQPHGLLGEPADGERGNRYGHRDGEQRGESKVGAAEAAVA